MKKALIILLFFGMLIFPAMIGAKSTDKVTICHHPPGNPSDFHTITVSVNALKAHLKHGDTLGECEVNNNSCASDGECNEADLCTQGICIDGGCIYMAIDCDDSNPCTMDSCDVSVGCVNNPTPNNGVSCDDGNDCTGPDTCVDGACSGVAIADCCDENADCVDDSGCTIDICSDQNRCENLPVTCDDGDPCTEDICDDLGSDDYDCVAIRTTEDCGDGCDDGVDNDGDELLDCSDPDCQGNDACPVVCPCFDADQLMSWYLEDLETNSLIGPTCTYNEFTTKSEFKARWAHEYDQSKSVAYYSASELNDGGLRCYSYSYHLGGPDQNSGQYVTLAEFDECINALEEFCANFE